MARLFWNDGLICGGSKYGGKPLSSRKEEVIPWSGELNLGEIPKPS